MPKLPLAFLLAMLAGKALAAGEFYCCHDPVSGRKVCGDSLPEQCRGQSYRILDRGGNLNKDVAPPLTAEQKAQLAEENRRKKEQEEASREQRRRDQALLDTYATPQDIDISQGKAENDVKLAIQSAQAQMELSRKNQEKLLGEAEFYKNKPLPPLLERNIKAINHEMRVQQELIDVKNKEFDQIKAKYDADRKRYFELTGRRSAIQPGNNRPH